MASLKIIIMILMTVDISNIMMMVGSHFMMIVCMCEIRKQETFVLEDTSLNLLCTSGTVQVHKQDNGRGREWLCFFFLLFWLFFLLLLIFLFWLDLLFNFFLS